MFTVMSSDHDDVISDIEPDIDLSSPSSLTSDREAEFRVGTLICNWYLKHLV